MRRTTKSQHCHGFTLQTTECEKKTIYAKLKILKKYIYIYILKVSVEYRYIVHLMLIPVNFILIL